MRKISSLQARCQHHYKQAPARADLLFHAVRLGLVQELGFVVLLLMQIIALDHLVRIRDSQNLTRFGEVRACHRLGPSCCSLLEAQTILVATTSDKRSMMVDLLRVLECLKIPMAGSHKVKTEQEKRARPVESYIVRFIKAK
jgi:hypothetical protein